VTDEDGGERGASDDASAGDDIPDEPLADLAESVPERSDDDGSTDAERDRAAPGRPELDADGDRDPSALPGETGREGPLGDLAAEVDRRRDETDASDLDDVFTSQDVADLDVDAVWEQVESGGVGDRGDVAVEERVVPKANFCQRCEFFSSPPSVACGHEGTEILELVDTDSFRVRNCPKVAEEERLGDL